MSRPPERSALQKARDQWGQAALLVPEDPVPLSRRAAQEDLVARVIQTRLADPAALAPLWDLASPEVRAALDALGVPQPR